jgi:hypothetical protein
MGNGTRIDGPSSPPQPSTLETPDAGAISTTTVSSSSTADSKPIHEDPHAAEKTNTALKQNAVEAKTQRNVSGEMKQKELNEKLPPRTVQAGDDPHQLSKINVQNDPTQEGGQITRYPNGVTRERPKDNTPSRITPPPGGSLEKAPDGRYIVRDAQKKEVASQDKDGTMHVKTKHGEYTETPDGKVTYTTKEKTNPGDLRKPGTIPSNKYEDYGISTDGKTMRFPNGIEFNKETRRVTVPVEYYGGFREQGNVLGQRTGYGPGGRELYKVEKDGLYIKTREGTFKVGANDEVSFQPHK